MPWLANVFYYGKEYRSPRQKVKEGKLEQEGYREFSVTDFQEEPWQAAAALEEAGESPSGVEVDTSAENAENVSQQERRVPQKSTSSSEELLAALGAEEQPLTLDELFNLIASRG